MSETPEQNEHLPEKQSYIGQAWLVILLAFVFGSLLALVHTTLGPKIAENKRNETYSVIPALVPGSDREQTQEVVVEGQDGREVRVYKACASDGSHLGWVIPARGQGFADVIEVLIGQSADLSRITGMYVLAQKETPGLGDYIRGEDFLQRFEDKPTDTPLVVVKADPRQENEILALTGATISSESVTNIVNGAIENLRGRLEAHNGSIAAPGGPNG
jgi:electron transport complex protein RnfG